jgi:hypothetical protein
MILETLNQQPKVMSSLKRSIVGPTFLIVESIIILIVASSGYNHARA